MRRIGLQALPGIGKPGIPVRADIDRIEIQVGLLLLQIMAQQDGLQSAFRAVRIIEIEHAQAPGRRGYGHRFLFHPAHFQDGRGLPQQRGTVEFGEEPRAEFRVRGRESHGAVGKPAVIQVDRHRLVPHQGRFRIMPVQPDGYRLTQQRIRAGLDQEITFGQLGLEPLGLEGLHILVHQRQGLRHVRRIHLRTERQERQQGRREDEQQPTHASQAG